MQSSRFQKLAGKAVLLLPALAISACGGATQTPDDGGTGGADADGVGGASDGSGASSTAGSGGDGESSGGRSPGGSGGGSGGTVDGVGGSTGGTAPSTGGSGGAFVADQLVGLGDNCDEPGTFACARENELLALICDTDHTWSARETCESGERCDFTASAEVGLCREVLPQCHSESSDPFCTEAGLEICAPGGFETEVLEACGAGTSCTDDGCVLFADECPESAVGCSEDCFVDDSACEQDECGPYFISLPFEDLAEPLVVRLPHDAGCSMSSEFGCREDIYFGVGVNAWHIFEGVLQDTWVRVTVAPGWEMFRRYLDDSEERGLCRDPATECLILPPSVWEGSSPGHRDVIFQPLTDPPIARNVTFEVVPEGTTCD